MAHNLPSREHTRRATIPKPQEIQLRPFCFVAFTIASKKARGKERFVANDTLKA